MLKWLESAPKVKKGFSWGVPWTKGQLDTEAFERTEFKLGDVPTQSHIMAYWPDGSIKWTGHSSVLSTADKFEDLVLVEKNQELRDQVVEDKFNAYYVTAGDLTAKISKHSDRSKIFDYIAVKDKKLIQNVRLISSMADGEYVSQVSQFKVVQNGPIKAIIMLKGNYCCRDKEVNRFTLYISFFKDTNQVELTHTFEIDDDRSVNSLGIEYQTPLEGHLWNRHVGFVHDDGVYYEPVQSLFSRRHRYGNESYQSQVNGLQVEVDLNSQMVAHSNENAIWDSFFIEQLASQAYEVKKTTQAHLSKVKVGSGQRYSGSLYLDSSLGGVQVHLDKFWQKYPAELEVRHMSHDLATTRVWFWSPNATEMDFRHYDDRDHMLSAYEGMEELRSTPVGIANTSTLSWQLYDGPPLQTDVIAYAQERQNPARVVCSPLDYYQTKVFGIYSLPRQDIAPELEQNLDFLFEFYKKEVVQRDWYGYWNYGDFMHSYDPYRHMWLYDFGGYAWQNNELVPSIWLWLYFLRTGRSDVFDIAEAMARHTSEVDVYHDGEYKGLGSRHNVVHWGCQAKETRISMAWLHRYYYYLTCDERTKELLEEVKDNEVSFESLQPLREFYEPEGDWSPVRAGPDWTAVVSNWYTYYEMHGDKDYLGRLNVGIDDLYEMPYKFLSGPCFMFNPKTKHFKYMGVGNVGGYHMTISFGGPQVLTEIAETENNSKLKQMIAEFGRFYTLNDEEMRQETNGALFKAHFAWPMFATTMMAYAATYYDDKELAATAWQYLTDPDLSGVPANPESTLKNVSGLEELSEMDWVTTNVVSQWCINVMICLELIGDKFPK